MSRKSWSSQKAGPIRLGDKTPSEAADIPQAKIHAVPKAALEEGILQLLASAAEMQQRQDLDSALQLYEAAMEKVKAHGLNRKRLFTGISKKPPPLNSKTPLQWCLHVGDMASAICLLGNPNIALAELRTTISTDRIEQLLDAGADLEYRIGPVGRTLLLQEIVEGRHAGVRSALNRGASISVMDDNGDTALALALSCEKLDTPLIVTDLIEAGADVNARDGRGRPLLALALAQGQPDAVAQIITAFENMSIKHTEIMKSWAANLPVQANIWTSRTCDVLRLLLDHGLDPNTQLQSKVPCALFDVAVRQQAASCENLVERLVDRGAVPNLEAALHGGSSQTLELILGKITPLHDIHHQQITNWINSLHREPHKWSQRDLSVLKLLLDYGLDPDFRRPGAPHSPLIVCAASAGDLSFVQKLITLQAKLNVADDNSDTALICAAKKSNRGIYDALKHAGVNDSIFFGMITVWSSHQTRS